MGKSKKESAKVEQKDATAASADVQTAQAKVQAAQLALAMAKAELARAKTGSKGGRDSIRARVEAALREDSGHVFSAAELASLVGEAGDEGAKKVAGAINTLITKGIAMRPSKGQVRLTPVSA